MTYGLSLRRAVAAGFCKAVHRAATVQAQTHLSTEDTLLMELCISTQNMTISRNDSMTNTCKVGEGRQTGRATRGVGEVRETTPLDAVSGLPANARLSAAGRPPQ